MTETTAPTADLHPRIGLLAGLGLAVFGSIVAQLFFFFPPAAGMVWLLLFSLALLWLHRKTGPAVALNRIGGSTLLALLAAVPATLVLGLGLSGLIQTWAGPIPFPIPLPEGNRIEAYVAPLGGWFTFTLYAAVVGPVIEELAFRGWIQQSFGRRFGAATGVLLGAFLFAVFHLWYIEPAAVLVPFVLGIVLGKAVHLTGSVWTAIVLHGAWNAFLMLILRTGIDPAVLFYWRYEDLGALVPAVMVLGAGVALGIVTYGYRRVSDSEAGYFERS